MTGAIWTLHPHDVSIGAPSGDDECCSLSSTVSSGFPPKLLSEPLSPSAVSTETIPSPKTRRSVSFDEEGSRYYENHLYAEDECTCLWFDEVDYHNFKSTNSCRARMIYQAEGVDDCPCPSSFTGVMEDVYLACCHLKVGQLTLGLTRSQEVRLQQLFRGGDEEDDRLGLERRSVKFISRDKNRRRDDLVRIMYNVQLARSWRDEEVLADELRWKCENVTRPSRLFAQSLAKALQDSQLQESEEDLLL